MTIHGLSARMTIMHPEAQCDTSFEFIGGERVDSRDWSQEAFVRRAC
jgi:hypothetical protein